MNPELIERIRKLISDGNFQDALDLFDDSTADAPILALKSRLNILIQKSAQGIISAEDETLETNKIVAGLLEWIQHGSASPSTAQPGPAVKIDEQMITLIKTKLTHSLRFYYWIAGIPIAIGVVLIIFFLGDKSVSAVESIGSVFVSSISGFPIKEIFSRRDRISLLEIISSRADQLSDKDIEKIKQLYFGKNTSITL